MTFLEYLFYGLGIILGLYLVARVTSAAFFRSKADHDLRSKHHDRQNLKP